ncbi:hypothetical protein [Kallipyga gabonensis]|nr:hypothetical protein [Kallipyga gabonensis]
MESGVVVVGEKTPHHHYFHEDHYLDSVKYTMTIQDLHSLDQ